MRADAHRSDGTRHADRTQKAAHRHQLRPCRRAGNPAEGEVKWLSFVTGYLRPAIKHGAVDLWLDRLMPGGADWEREIEQKLRTCDIFLLLVSRHSLSSDYVVDKEIKIIRERQAKGEAVHFYPLVLTPTPKIALAHIRDYNLRPKDGRPLSDFPLNERYRQMVIVADEVEELITTATSSETQMQTETPKELLTGGRQGPKSVEDSISQPRGKRADGDLNDAPVDHDSRRWRRIQITMSGTRRDPRLSFTVSSGPKLVEASTIAAKSRTHGSSHAPRVPNRFERRGPSFIRAALAGCFEGRTTRRTACPSDFGPSQCGLSMGIAR